MTKTAEVYQEIILGIENGPGYTNEKSIFLPGDLSEHDVVKKAAEISGRLVQRPRKIIHRQCSFYASTRLIAQVDGDELISSPKVLIPRSHFGEAREMTAKEKKRYKNYAYVVDTITDQIKPLAPGDRVYGLDGALKFTTPAVK